MDEQNCDFQITIKSQGTFLPAARDAIQAAARKVGLDDKACGHIILALTEAMINIIKHGYSGEPGHPIWIGLKQIEKEGRAGVRIILEDECPQIDLEKIKSRPLDEFRPGGLGVHIIKEIMEDVTYAHRECGKGLRLTMYKFVPPAAAATAPSAIAG